MRINMMNDFESDPDWTMTNAKSLNNFRYFLFMIFDLFSIMLIMLGYNGVCKVISQIRAKGDNTTMEME